MTKKGARGEMAPFWAVLFLVQKGTFSTWGARGKWRQFGESFSGLAIGSSRGRGSEKKRFFFAYYSKSSPIKY